MQFDHPFLKLPICFDAATLAAEVRALPASAWDPHPTGFFGNEAVELVSDAIWPDAEFVNLYRDVRQTLTSMIEAWRSGAFRTYPRLPGWQGLPWSLLLIPGWQKLNGMSLPEVAAHQWAATTDILLDDLEAVGPSRVRAVDYNRFLAIPQFVTQNLAASLDLAWDRQLSERLPLSKTTVSDPRTDKWKLIAPVIESVLPIAANADARARAFLETRRI